MIIIYNFSIPIMTTKKLELGVGCMIMESQN